MEVDPESDAGAVPTDAPETEPVPIALVLILPGFIIHGAMAEATMAIEASVAAEGVSVQESYTLRMTAGDASCPMPGGKRGGSYDLVLSGPGAAAFPAMTFNAPGDYAYTIRQLPGNHALALSYDDSVYDLRVQVREVDGKLRLTAIMNRQGSDKKAASADFSVTYVDPVTGHNPPVKKTVTGDKPATTATFKFRFQAVSNTAGLKDMPMPEGSTNGVKTVSVAARQEKEFGEMTFEVPGKYVYKVTEVNDKQKGYTYDKSAHTLTYTVERKGDALTCAREIKRDGKAVSQMVFTFTNQYKKTTSGGGSGDTGGDSTPKVKTEISGQKICVDGGNAHHVRPADITIHLYTDGEAVDAEPTWIKSGNTWIFSYGKLPQTDDNGDSISYTVEEDEVPYYQTSVSGLTITNTLEDRSPFDYIDIAGQKTWDDDGTGRPASITVRLLRDGEAVEQRTVTSANDWQYRFGHAAAAV